LPHIISGNGLEVALRSPPGAATTRGCEIQKSAEHQLAHAVRDPNGRAYNRTAHLPERRRMMQQWADYLDKLKVGAEVIPLRGHMA
jgi:hypothetical protein